MSTDFSVADTVGALVARHPSLSRVFEQAGIDYCCGGRKTLEQACQEKRIDPSGGGPMGEGWTLAHPIRQMESEHDQAGAALARLRELTDGFETPAWACNTYRALLDALTSLERDMHLHIHKENNVLFPRALELERGSRAARV
jgi:iron-sulfur cluster repair protein YtfE (RIC family)